MKLTLDTRHPLLQKNHYSTNPQSSKTSLSKLPSQSKKKNPIGLNNLPEVVELVAEAVVHSSVATTMIWMWKRKQK